MVCVAIFLFGLLFPVLGGLAPFLFVLFLVAVGGVHGAPLALAPRVPLFGPVFVCGLLQVSF